MAAPFYLLFLPLFLIFAFVVWAFFVRVTHDIECDWHSHMKSDLEKAQELERQEAAARQKA